MKRVKLSATHSISKSELTGTHSLEDTQEGKTECTGTYTQCFKIAKDLKLKNLMRSNNEIRS